MQAATIQIGDPLPKKHRLCFLKRHPADKKCNNFKYLGFSNVFVVMVVMEGMVVLEGGILPTASTELVVVVYGELLYLKIYYIACVYILSPP